MDEGGNYLFVVTVCTNDFSTAPYFFLKMVLLSFLVHRPLKYLKTIQMRIKGQQRHQQLMKVLSSIGTRVIIIWETGTWSTRSDWCI